MARGQRQPKTGQFTIDVGAIRAREAIVMLGKKVFEYGLGRPLANNAFKLMHQQVHSIQRRGIAMMHTARPFDFYRKVFYRGTSEADLLAQLSGQFIVDVGCGYTPYADDSMFHICNNTGIEFYGVDPVIEDEKTFALRDRLLARAVGSRGRLRATSVNTARTVRALAQALPFDDGVVDQILCAYLLFVWIEDEPTLADILSEFSRVLKPGGVLKLYPLAEWTSVKIQDIQLLSVLKAFEIEQTYVPADLSTRVAPSLLTEFTKYHY